jgi:hypothetical protein
MIMKNRSPVFDGWPDAPCAYVQFGSNPAFELIYKGRFAYARREGNHLHMLIELHSVVQALLDLTGQPGV